MPFPFYTRPPFEDRQLVQYSGTSITLSGDTNVYPTGNLRIYKNAFPGLVATSIDADGTVGWGPISGISWSVSACTSPLYVNNLVSCPLSAGTIQVDAGSFDLNSELRFLISLSAGTNNDEVLVVDSNGYVKSVSNLGGIGNMWYVPFGYTLTVPDNYQSFIYGDLYVLGTIDLQTNAQLVVLNGNIILSGGSIIGSGTTQLVTLGGGGGCCFTGGTGSCITDFYVSNIHSCSPLNINPLDEGNIYFGSISAVTIDLQNNGNLYVKGENIIHTNLVSDPSSLIPGLNGQSNLTILFNTPTGSTGIVTSNPSTSGSSRLILGQSFAPNPERHISINHYGPDYIRDAIAPTNGFDFYKNKSVIANSIDSNGLVISLDVNGNQSRLWFEENAESGMIIAGRGIGNGLSLGISLNPDGTEMPSSNLQIGGTGTTGTFKYIDGNQQNGYVLTSDSDGNATWQVPTGGGGGGTFTGNTSASCITDLYLTNIYGCGNDVNIISTTNITGNTYINGTLYATSKSFSIPHPLDENKLLVYGSLEGPENGVYHRGKLIDYNVIQLPNYWSKLVDINTVTVNLTPNGKYQNLFVKEILEDKIIIDINNGWFGNEKINCFYTVYGERKDIDKLKVER